MRNCWPNREHWERGDRFNASGVGGYFMGGKSPLVKSIQTGTIAIAGGATSNTATVTSFDTANSDVQMTFRDAEASQDNTGMPRLAVSNATTLTATRTSATGAITTVAFTIIEYNTGFIKSVQRATLSKATAASATATITSVDTTKASVTMQGWMVNSGTPANNDNFITCVLTNATTVTNQDGGGVALTTLSNFQVLEWNP